MHGTITWVQLLGQLRYDTIRDAILIYHMEPTTRKWKTEKLKTVKVWEIHVVSPEEEKERLRWEGFEEKEGCGGKDLKKRKVLSLEWKSERVMEN